MDSLVERLRREANFVAAAYDLDDTSVVIDEAAARIAALEAEVASLDNRAMDCLMLSDRQALRIAALEEQLAGRDAEIAAWLRAASQGYGNGIGKHVLAVASDAIASGDYRKDVP